MSRYNLWYRIIIAGKVYLGEGSLDNALFSAARRHDFDEDHGYDEDEKEVRLL